MKNKVVLLFLLLSNLCIAQSYNIYVSDAGNFNNPPWQILKYDGMGANPQVFTNSNLAWPQDILFLEDSNLMLVSNLNTNNITKYNATTGAYLGVFASGISGPTRMKIGPDSSLYVLQWSGNGKVKRFDLSGNFLGDFTTTSVTQSIGIDWDVTGNLYVSSYNGDHIRKYDTSGTDMGLFISSNLVGPTNIWFMPNGELMVSDYDGGAIKKFSSTGSYLGVFTSGLSQSEGYEYLPNGHLLIGNGGTASVREFDSTGTFIKNFIPGRSGGLIRPNALRIRHHSTTGFIEPIEERPFQYQIIDHQMLVDRRGVYSLEAIDISGRRCLQQSCNDQCTIQLDQLNEGLFIFKITDTDQLSSIVKVHLPAFK